MVGKLQAPKVGHSPNLLIIIKFKSSYSNFH